MDLLGTRMVQLGTNLGSVVRSIKEMQTELLELRNRTGERSYNSYDRTPRKEEDGLKLGDLPEFDSTQDASTFLDWERR